MNELNNFIKVLTHLIDTTDTIQKRDENEKFIIHFIELSDFYKVSEYNRKIIISLLEEYLINSGKDNFEFIIPLISKKIDTYLNFHINYSKQLEDFNVKHCIKQSLSFLNELNDDQIKVSSKIGQRLSEIPSLIDSAFYSPSDEDEKIKDLRHEEKFLDVEYKKAISESELQYDIYAKERKERAKYRDISFEKIANELKSIQDHLSLYSIQPKKHHKPLTQLIFKPEVFGTSHRVINDLCDIPLSEEGLKSIFDGNSVLNKKLKLKTSSKEKLYYVIRQLPEFISGNTEEKKEWSCYVVEQFEGISLSTFLNKNNLLINDEKFRNRIEKEFKKLRKGYLNVI